jgi:glycosyltransferase involved in cell wall biosynthesis
MILPVLQSLAKDHSFRLKIVGAGTDVSVAGIDIESLPWNLEREIRDFQSIDIGLYPIDSSAYSEWAKGKSGFKAVQYLAVGVPYVATPLGGSLEIGEAGATHFFASTEDEWYRALKILITDEERRREMGRRGREFALQHYTLEAHAEILAKALKQAFRSAQPA